MKMTLLLLYRVYQIVVMIPSIVVLTVLTGIVTIIGSLAVGGRFWGYWPPHIWAKICTWLTLVKVEVRGRENIQEKTSYVFVANHQGAYDIFTIYGFLHHNFKWMMKIGLRKFPVIGISCKAAAIYLSTTRLLPRFAAQWLRLRKPLREECLWLSFLKVRGQGLDVWGVSTLERSSSRWNFSFR